jgi:DNA-binding response OmpR family regulator
MAPLLPEQFSPGPKVLVVHEDPSSLCYYREIFEELGLRVVTQNSYVDGLSCLDGENYGLIVVSQGGRGFEGGCILEHLRETQRSIPVLVVTRRRDSRAYLKAWELGAVSYRKEPVSVPEIVHLVRSRLHLQVNPSETAEPLA